MIKKVLELVVNANQAENALRGVDKNIQKIDKDLVKTEQEFSNINQDAVELDKNLKNVPKVTNKISGGFRKMGTALKAAGIGLVISAFVVLKDLFTQNQKIVDLFSIAFESLSLAFADFFDYISDNVSAVTGFFKAIFENPLDSLKRFANAIKQNLINRVVALIDTFGYLGDTIIKLFSGDFEGAMDSAVNAGKSLVDTWTGVPDTVDKVSESVSNGVASVTEYTKSIVSTAAANVELKKSAELAAVANQGLIEKYDLLAEKQRQIRDDDRKSISERIAANDELGEVLEKQKEKMLENANISLRAAQAELKKDKNNIQFKKAVMEAENELAAVKAQVAGFESEQLTNKAALQKEEKDMINSILESEANLSIEQKRFNAEQIKDELERLNALKDIDEEERDLQLNRLNNQIALYKKGTQARIDAEIALNEAKQQFAEQDVLRTKEIEKAKQEIRDKADAKELANRQALEESIFQVTATSIQAIATLTDIFAQKNEKNAKRAFKIQKALNIATTIMNTAAAIMQVAKQTTDFTPLQILRNANMIAMGIAGGLQVVKIAQQKFEGGTPANTVSGFSGAGGLGGGGGGGMSPQAPEFNIVGQSGFNQIAGALGQQPPVQAYVVAGNVTTAQQLQNNTIQQATF
jgi:hypothetical protein